MKNYILGTDWWTDCDDAVAVRLLARAHKRGDINLLGIVINACMEDSVRSLDGFLNLEECKNIPLGIDSEARDFGGRLTYQFRLAPYATRYSKNEDAEAGVRLYRRLLALSDKPVEIIEIGFLQTFVALLDSNGDDISAKSGIELVREKVSKCWVMAGKWDADGEKEHNFCHNERTRVAAKAFCEKCPVPVTFLGWEIGYGVLSGGNLDKSDHLYKVLQDHGSSRGRHSWDPMLTLLALTGDEGAAGYRTVCGRARVDAASGFNYFDRDASGTHAYVIKTKDDSYYQDAINELIK